MSAQSKAMYWQARAMELEAMVERMADVLDDVEHYYDDAKDDCAICGNGIFAGHSDGCVIPDVQKALSEYAAMKGVPSASKEEI